MEVFHGIPVKKQVWGRSNLAPWWFKTIRSEREMRWEAAIIMRRLTRDREGKEIHGMRKREQGMAQNIVIKDILLVMGRRIMKAPKELLCEDPGLAEIRGKTGCATSHYRSLTRAAPRPT